MTSRYKHLLQGVADGLPTAICLEVDDVRDRLDVSTFCEIAWEFFRANGEIDRTYFFWTEADRRPGRLSRKGFERRDLFRAIVGVDVGHIAISSGYSNRSIDDTWNPNCFATASRHGRSLNVFLYCGGEWHEKGAQIEDLYTKHFSLSGSCAALFEFPLAFSPRAYFTGITFDPNSRALGTYSLAESRRVTNWRDHCYSGGLAREGYLRDIFPVNYLTQPALQRTVQGKPLLSWIAEASARGSVSPLQGGLRWEVPLQSLASVRQALDQNGLLLAGLPQMTRH